MRALIVLFAVALFAVPARAETPAWLERAMQERSLGDADAPVTIIDYSSMTCPHCARFHLNRLEKLKKKLIEPGRARLVFRDFPLDKVALKASKLARCMPEGRYWAFLDTLFDSQERWARADNPARVLKQTARLAGLSDERIDACLTSEKLTDAILEGRMTGARTHEVQSTPTFVVDGEKIVGNKPVSAFVKAVEQATAD